MNKKIQNTSFFKNIDKYLNEDTDLILDDINKEYNYLINTVDNRNNKAIKEHLSNRILPAIAIYKTLLKHGYTKENAYSLIENYVFTETEKIAKTYRTLGKLPSFYNIFVFIFNIILKSSFPKEGWTIEWVEKTKINQKFIIKSCLYFETFSSFNYPELTRIFCKTDEICYKNMSKELSFIRNGTIANNNEYCDFEFKKN